MKSSHSWPNHDVSENQAKLKERTIGRREEIEASWKVSPCDGCPYVEKCKEEEISCRGFERWIRGLLDAALVSRYID